MEGHSLPTGQLRRSGRSKEAVSGLISKKGSESRTSRRLFDFDREFGVRFVAGTDEAGRGCLAGPLVAAAVLFDYEALGKRELSELSKLDDSKVHSAKVREELYPKVLSAAKAVSVGTYSPAGIDSRGLHNTNLLALQKCLEAVAIEGCVCLVDGYKLPDLDLDHRAVVDGDARSAAIAAASIIAKVSRDRYMISADELHPGWGFAEHVGYSTAEHRAAIEKKGISTLHRRSFRSVAYKQLGLIDETDSGERRRAA